MIQLKNINKIYVNDIFALKNINLTVAPGEIVGVIGKSGAGKSTLIRCVNLLERPTSGHVYIDNIDITTLNQNALRQIRHKIGMVFQHFNLLSTRTVFDNVALPLILINQSKSIIDQKVLFLLEKVGLLNFQKFYPHQLSGGQKQRVAIARALATDPTVLLCDEMTSALDPETTDDILNLIRMINQELKLSILLITHQMEVIKNIADSVAVIEQGEIIECESVVELFKNPKTNTAKKFVQTVFKSDLPIEFQSKLNIDPIENGEVILRLTFIGHTTLEPVIDELVRNEKIKVNILQANIEKLRQITMGRMIIAMQLTQATQSESVRMNLIKRFLENKGLTVEVMGYVDDKAWLVG